MKHFQPLWDKLSAKTAHAGDVAAWPTETGYYTVGNRIGLGRENDRNGSGRSHNGANAGQVAPDEDDGNFTRNEIGRHRWYPIEFAAGPAIFDGNVPALDKADFAEALLEPAH